VREPARWVEQREAARPRARSAVIDTHCHLLPGIDDGPPTVDEAVALAWAMASQGVEVAVCTPHWSREFPTSTAQSSAARAALADALQQADIRVELVVSAELTAVVAATERLDEIRERSIGGRIVLVEMVEDTLPAHVSAVTRRLAAAGMSTVLAHPERCGAVQSDPRLLDHLRDEDAYVQVVAPSLTGHRATREGDTAWELLDMGRVDLIASDAHGSRRRPCQLEAAEELVTERFGPAAWRELTGDAPRRLLDGIGATADGIRRERPSGS
jgi:protein-tyrosine phosphatase